MGIEVPPFKVEVLDDPFPFDKEKSETVQKVRGGVGEPPRFTVNIQANSATGEEKSSREVATAKLAESISDKIGEERENVIKRIHDYMKISQEIEMQTQRLREIQEENEKRNNGDDPSNTKGREINND